MSQAYLYLIYVERNTAIKFRTASAQNSRQSTIALRRYFIYKNHFGGIITLKKYIQKQDDLGFNKNLVFKSR